MKTSLDTFYDELEALCDKHGYIVTSVQEEIDTDTRALISLSDMFPSVVRGYRQINLTMRAIRIKKLDKGESREQ